MNVNDAGVEAAAEGFYMSGPGGSEKHWDDLTSAQKAHFRSRARIALEAAAQHMLAVASEEGYGLGYSDSVWSKGHEPRERNPYL